MTDRMIPVPESLIERAERFDRRGGLGSEVHAWLGELHALLSQPTPTAEPGDVELCDCGEPAAVCAAKRAIPTVPPRIEEVST